MGLVIHDSYSNSFLAVSYPCSCGDTCYCAGMYILQLLNERHVLLVTAES